MNETDPFSPIRELVAKWRNEINSRSLNPFIVAYDSATLTHADELEKPLPGLEKSLKEREQLDVKCPAGHASFTEGCKHCGIIRDCENDSRSQLVTIILQWHDAFYREAGDEARRQQEQAVHAAKEAVWLCAADELLAVFENSELVNSVRQLWIARAAAERKLGGG